MTTQTIPHAAHPPCVWAHFATLCHALLCAAPGTRGGADGAFVSGRAGLGGLGGDADYKYIVELITALKVSARRDFLS